MIYQRSSKLSTMTLHLSLNLWTEKVFLKERRLTKIMMESLFDLNPMQTPVGTVSDPEMKFDTRHLYPLILAPERVPEKVDLVRKMLSRARLVTFRMGRGSCRRFPIPQTESDHVQGSRSRGCSGAPSGNSQIHASQRALLRRAILEI